MRFIIQGLCRKQPVSVSGYLAGCVYIFRDVRAGWGGSRTGGTVPWGQQNSEPAGCRDTSSRNLGTVAGAASLLADR